MGLIVSGCRLTYNRTPPSAQRCLPMQGMSLAQSTTAAPELERPVFLRQEERPRELLLKGMVDGTAG
jgi:hypothetical protein